MPFCQYAFHREISFRLIIAFVYLNLVPCSVIAADTQPLTPSSVRELIKTQGATSAIDQLDQQGQYDALMDYISTGKSEWIALAPEIAKGTDAGSSEELTISLALALPLDADAVLEIMTSDKSSPLSPHAICSAPFSEDTVADIPDYLKRSIAAVSAVKETNLKDPQQVCLAELHQAASLPTYNP